MILYANSDSYGILSTGKVYAEFIAEAISADRLINSGLSGSCNQRIIRTTIRDCLTLKKENKDIFALISIAQPNRFEYWGEVAVNNDGHFQSFQPNTPLTAEPKKFADSWNRLYDDEAATTNLFAELVKLTSFFKSNGIQYLIWSGPSTIKSVDFNTPFISDFAEYVFNDTNIIDLFGFSFVQYCLDNKFIPFDYNQYGDHGHHGEEAHRTFANYLLENYLNEI